MNVGTTVVATPLHTRLGVRSEYTGRIVAVKATTKGPWYEVDGVDASGNRKVVTVRRAQIRLPD